MFPVLGRARYAVFCAAALIITLGYASAKPAMASPTAQGATSVEIAPGDVQLACGETVDVDVAINDVEDLFGVDIKVSFDPAKLEVVDANTTTPGTQVKPGDLPDVSGGQGLIQVNNVDSATGTVSYAAVRLNPAPAQSGSGTIATITFKGKAAGTSAINIVSGILANQNASQIDATTSNGSATVECDGNGGGGGGGGGGGNNGGGGRPGGGRPGGGHGDPDDGHGGYPGGGHGGPDGWEDGCAYVVKPGDTLYSIANMFGTSVSAIMAANKLYDADKIYAGQTLHIPGCKDGGPHPKPPIYEPVPPIYKPEPPIYKPVPPIYKPEPPIYKPVPPVGKDCMTHVVKPGETLYSIAYLYGVSPEGLAYANGIVNPDLIYAGQPLVICDGHGYPKPMPYPEYPKPMPYPEQPKPMPMPYPEYPKKVEPPYYPGPDYGKYPDWDKKPYPPTHGKCGYMHVVKPGETLYGISMQYGVSPHEIAYANNLVSPDMIYAGQALCIP